MFETLLENISKFASNKKFEPWAKEAYDIYERKAGSIYQDDHSYENRMTAFLEWFILNRPVTEDEQTVLDIYRHERARGSDEELSLVDALKNNIHDVFVVKSVKSGALKATGLFANKNFVITTNESTGLLHKGDIFEGRIVQVGNQWLMTHGMCHHPSKALKFIKSEMKRIRKSGGDGLDDFFFALAAMSTKWERSRQIDVEKIYSIS